MSLERELEPDWVNDYDTKNDEFDPDLDRDRREAEAIEDEYGRRVETHSWPGSKENW